MQCSGSARSCGILRYLISSQYHLRDVYSHQFMRFGWVGIRNYRIYSIYVEGEIPGLLWAFGETRSTF